MADFPVGVSLPRKPLRIEPPRPDSLSAIVPDHHVRRDGDDYAEAWANLLPQGIAWPRDPDTVLMQTLRGLAQIWGLVDSRAADLLERETDPRTTVELLTDWERAFGLPDPCFREAETIGERQKQLVMKMTMLGGQSREFFIGVAAWLGYTVSIEEYSPFMVGVSRVGDTRQASDVVIKDAQLIADTVTLRSFGTTAMPRRGQNFTANIPSLRAIDCVLAKSGDPTDCVIASLYLADINGLPTGTRIAKSTPIDAFRMAFFPSFSPQTFDFAPPPVLTLDTRYAVVIERTTALNNSNYYMIGTT